MLQVPFGALHQKVRSDTLNIEIRERTTHVTWHTVNITPPNTLSETFEIRELYRQQRQSIIDVSFKYSLYIKLSLCCSCFLEYSYSQNSHALHSSYHRQSRRVFCFHPLLIIFTHLNPLLRHRLLLHPLLLPRLLR